MTLHRLLAVALLVGGAAAHGATIDYLHVAANDGGSSGGHAAIRFGRQVYHFQHTGGGLLALVRHDDRYFDWRYRTIENRTIRAARIKVEQGVYDQLHARFNERHLLQGRQLAARESLANDRRLLEAWLVPDRGADTVRVRGAALFYENLAEAAPTVETSSALSDLRAYVEQNASRGILQARTDEIRRALLGLVPVVDPLDRVQIFKDQRPQVGHRFSDRHQDLAAQLVALSTLRYARPLRRSAVRFGPPITSAERRALARYRDRLRRETATLLSSQRPDWGFPALLAMARLEAIDASVRTGRLVVLDAFPSDASIIAGDDRRMLPFLQELAESARRAFEGARAAVLSDQVIAERDYARLEAATNRYLETKAGVEQGTHVRLSAARLIPDHSALIRGVPRPKLADSETAARLVNAKRAEAAYGSALEGVYGYDLFGTNCVTEIFATIEATYDPMVSEARLGGHIAATAPLTFVPFLSFHEVATTYDRVSVETHPSHRIRAVRAMGVTQHPLMVHLRESNTLTSTIYRRNGDDPTFLFFTDDTVLLRPLYGSANLVVGLGPTLAGLVRAPFDRGASLRRELRGVAATLPELAFVNVRKGRMMYGPQ